MSTYQPPGGPSPEGTPSYPQPQDPWATGHDHGLASVPTDPIPHQYDPYAHGVAEGDIWVQQTVAHGGQQPYGYLPQQQQRSRAGLVLVVFLAVLVLGGGGGYAAWYVITQQRQGSASANSSTSSAQTQPPTSAADPAGSFDPHTINVGDCIVNKGTATKPQVQMSACSAGSYKVIFKVEGVKIKENADGNFDAATTSVEACKGTNFQSWYGYKDAADDKKDVFFCLTNN